MEFNVNEIYYLRFVSFEEGDRFMASVTKSM